MSDSSSAAQGPANPDPNSAPAPQRPGGVARQFIGAIKDNIVTAVVGGMFVFLGLFGAMLWTSASEFVQARIDKSVAQALEAKDSETKKALFDVLKKSVEDKQHDLRRNVIVAVREALDESERRKVGALSSGTIELRSQYPEHTIYFYLPKTNKGQLLVNVDPRNTVAEPGGALIRIALDNVVLPNFLGNASAEYDLDLNEKLRQSLSTRRNNDSLFMDPNTSLPQVEQPLQPTTMRFGDLHTVTFRAHKDAFGKDGNANIWIKYIVLVRPTIMVD